MATDRNQQAGNFDFLDDFDARMMHEGHEAFNPLLTQAERDLHFKKFEYHYRKIQDASIYETRGTNNNQSLDLNRWSTSHKFDSAVDHIFNEMSSLAAGTGQAKKTKRCLKMILANLVHAYFLDLEKWVRYSRDGRYYHLGKRRHNPLGIGLRSVIRVMDALVLLKYVVVVPPYGRTKNSLKEGRQTHIRATVKLISLLQGTFGINAGMITQYKSMNSIRVKDKDDFYIDFYESSEYRRLRRHIDDYNELLAGADIRLKDCPEVKRLKRLRPVDFSRTDYFRTFKNCSFSMGGRFFGPWWQNMKRELRPLLLINGNETVELDYGAMFVHLAYSLEGEIYWDCFNSDPYELPTMPDLDRNISKLVLLFSFNNSYETTLIKAVIKALNEEDIYKGDIDLRAVLKAHKGKHSVIEHKILSNCGNDLMTREAEVSAYVIEKMTKAGIVALNVHDSFIVETQHQEFLNQTMLDAFIELGLVSVPRIDETWKNKDRIDL
jgi:hypothetical protein